MSILNKDTVEANRWQTNYENLLPSSKEGFQA